MKKVILVSISALFAIIFAGCATNFATWDAWKADKEGEKFAAEVMTSEVKDGYIYGMARLYKDGTMVKYIQKPYLKTEKPFEKGFTIFVNVNDKK